MKKAIFLLFIIASLSSCKKEFKEIILKPAEVWLYVEGKPPGELIKIYSKNIEIYPELVEDCDCSYKLNLSFINLKDINGLEEEKLTKIFEGCGSSDFIYVEIGNNISKIKGFEPGKVLVIKIKFGSIGKAIVSFEFYEVDDENTHINLNN